MTVEVPLRIIAGRHHQAKLFAELEGLEKTQWKLVSSLHDLLGLDGIQVTFVGTYWQLPEFSAISELVDHRVATGRFRYYERKHP